MSLLLFSFCTVYSQHSSQSDPLELFKLDYASFSPPRNSLVAVATGSFLHSASSHGSPVMFFSLLVVSDLEITCPYLIPVISVTLSLIGLPLGSLSSSQQTSLMLLRSVSASALQFLAQRTTLATCSLL